jgi:ParB family transcriptional regulator, chromosome partitioning protein
MSKPALGRGLGALLGAAPAVAKPVPIPASTPAPAPKTEPPAPDNRERVLRLPVQQIRPNPLQPRKEFTPDALKELADSIREQGILQPLVVRQRDQHFELIAGERRFRASQLLGLAEVPVIVREADDRALLELALIENLQRENLNPLEEAQGYAELIAKFSLRQEDVSLKVGKSRVAVANSLRLLKLPAEVQTLVRDGQLSVGHAKVILGLPGDTYQKLAAERVIKQGLNVRQTEELVAHMQQPAAAPGSKAQPVAADSNITAVETRLRERFGTKVQLRYRQGKGALEIRFFNDDDLDRILDILGVKID